MAGVHIKTSELYHKYRQLEETAAYHRKPEREAYAHITRALIRYVTIEGIQRELAPFAVMPAVATNVDTLLVPIYKAFLDELELAVVG